MLFFVFVFVFNCSRNSLLWAKKSHPRIKMKRIIITYFCTNWPQKYFERKIIKFVAFVFLFLYNTQLTIFGGQSRSKTFFRFPEILPIFLAIATTFSSSNKQFFFSWWCCWRESVAFVVALLVWIVRHDSIGKGWTVDVNSYRHVSTGKNRRSLYRSFILKSLILLLLGKIWNHTGEFHIENQHYVYTLSPLVDQALAFSHFSLYRSLSSSLCFSCSFALILDRLLSSCHIYI